MLQYQRATKLITGITALMVAVVCISFVTNPLAMKQEDMIGFQSTHRLFYGTKEGLYSVEWKPNTKQEYQVQQLTIGQAVIKPACSEDGSTVFFRSYDQYDEQHMDHHDLYAYRLTDQQANLIVKECLSFCSGAGNTAYASTSKDGLFCVDAQGKKNILLQEKVKNGWYQYENLSLSPDKTKLAFQKVRYVERENSDENDPYEVQFLGVYLYDLNNSDKNSNLIRVEQAKEGLPDYGQSSYPGKWSGNSQKLFIWQDAMSASLHADGVGGSVYDVPTNTLTYLNESTASDSLAQSPMMVLLAYEENVSFTEDGTLVMLNGGGRDMYDNKVLQRVTWNKNQKMIKNIEERLQYQTIETPNLTPSAPIVTSDGKAVYFLASPEIKGKVAAEEWSNLYPLKKQIYVMENGTLTQLTTDEQYVCESPLLTKEEKELVFGRIDLAGNMSIWKMNIDGSGLEKLADLAETTQKETNVAAEESNYPNGYDNYYGRGSWYDKFTIY